MVYICVECDLRGRLHELKGARLPVLMAIALHTDGKTSWPTFDTIMQETGLARPTVAKAITDLEAGGWISVKREHRKASVYQLLTSQIHMNGNGSKTELKDGSRVQKVNSNGSESELNKVQKLNSMSKETELQEDTIEEDTTEEEAKEVDTPPPPAPVTGVDWAKAHIDCMNPWYEKAQNYRRKLKSHTGSATVWLATKLRETYGDIYTPEQVDAQIDKRASEGWTGTYYELFADSSNGNGSRRRGGFDQAEESRKAMAMLEAMEER